jgi:long-chain acyl-CoA synthetase
VTSGKEVWAFDVDGTLVDSMSGTSLRPHAMELLTTLQARGVTLVLWSAGGREHAHAMSLRHRFSHLFTAIYDKGDPDASGRLPTSHLPGGHVPDVVVDDRPEEAPEGVRVLAVPCYVAPDPADRGLCRLLELAVSAC